MWALKVKFLQTNIYVDKLGLVALWKYMKL